MSDGRRGAMAALEIKGLNVYYDASHALQGVDLELQSGVLSLVGRNGMGKTTLCKAIMGLEPISSGTISFGGQLLNGKTPTEIARLGVGYVPQGRRLWRSLTVDEHLRLVAQPEGAWSIERIYDSFPRLAERKSNGGAQLSGGEQQMLAIGRALLLNPKLLVMDEPTEGLAPVIVAHVQDMLLRLAAEGAIDVLVIEQNIGVATSVAGTVAVMVNGQVSRIVPSRELASDRDLQQRLLGVGQHAHDEEPIVLASQPQTAEGSLAKHYQPAKFALPQLTRWSSVDRPVEPLASAPDPITETESAGIVVIGAMERLSSVISEVCSKLRQAGQKVTSVDISMQAGIVSSSDVPAHRLAAWHPSGAAGIHDGRDGDSRLGQREALKCFLDGQSGIESIIAILNAGETIILAPTICRSKVQTPTTVVSELPSVDLAPLQIGKSVLWFKANGADEQNKAIHAAGAAVLELLTARLDDAIAQDVQSHLAIISGLGNQKIASQLLTELGQTWQLGSYAPTGHGMRALVEAQKAGKIQAILDLDQSDIAEHLFGNSALAHPDRFARVCSNGREYVSVLNGGDSVFVQNSNFDQVSIRVLDRTEAEAVGRYYAEALNATEGRITVVVPNARPQSPKAWLTGTFVSAFQKTASHQLVRAQGGIEERDILHHIKRALKDGAKSGVAPVTTYQSRAS